MLELYVSFLLLFRVHKSLIPARVDTLCLSCDLALIKLATSEQLPTLLHTTITMDYRQRFASSLNEKKKTTQGGAVASIPLRRTQH